ncbi:MAG TPA: hypothetical protein VJL87_05035 [Bdellovibrionota bacterium]|nr:hypothetical protein [Bdellovibrionota bacterium]
MAVARKKRRIRKQFIILKEFQVRFSLLLALVGFLVTLVVGLIIYRIYNYNINVLAEKGVVMSPAVIDFLSSMRSNIFHSLIAIFVGVTALLLLLGMFVSHRMAGPIYALLRQMRLLTHGDYNASLLLRKGDEFQILMGGYNDLVTSLQNRVKEDLIRLSRIKAELDDRIESFKKGGATPQQLQQLKHVQEDLDRFFEEKNNLLSPKAEQFTINDVVI